MDVYDEEVRGLLRTWSTKTSQTNPTVWISRVSQQCNWMGCSSPPCLQGALLQPTPSSSHPAAPLSARLPRPELVTRWGTNPETPGILLRVPVPCCRCCCVRGPRTPRSGPRHQSRKTSLPCGPFPSKLTLPRSAFPKWYNATFCSPFIAEGRFKTFLGLSKGLVSIWLEFKSAH